MNLVKICCNYNGVTGKLDLTVYQLPEYTETKNSYTWKGKRIAKDQIGVIDRICYNSSLESQFYYVFSLSCETDISMNKSLIKEFMLKKLLGMISDQKKLILTAETLLSNPVWKETERPYDY